MSTLLELLGSAPTAALPVALTLSGHEITPVTRVAATQGDGLVGEYRDSSIGVWEATTNLVTNGGFETNTTGHAGNAGTETVSRITTDSKFGAACLSSVTPGGATGEGWRTNSIAISAATAYAASFWFKAPAASTWTASFQNRDGGDAFISGIASDTTIVATGDWQRITLAGTSDASAANTRINLTTRSTAQAVTLKIDGVQLEAQPLATPYVHTDGGTASRTAARVRIPNPRRYLTETLGGIFLAYRMGFPATSSGIDGFPKLFVWYSDATNNFEVTYNPANQLIDLDRDGAGNGTPVALGAALTFARGDIQTFAFGWNATTLELAVNGGTFATAANSLIPDLSAAAFDIGSFQGSSGHLDSDLVFMATYNRFLTNADSVALNNIARNNRIDSRIEDLPSGCTFKWPSENWREGMAL